MIKVKLIASYILNLFCVTILCSQNNQADGNIVFFEGNNLTTLNIVEKQKNVLGLNLWSTEEKNLKVDGIVYKATDNSLNSKLL